MYDLICVLNLSRSCEFLYRRYGQGLAHPPAASDIGQKRRCIFQHITLRSAVHAFLGDLLPCYTHGHEPFPALPGVATARFVRTCCFVRDLGGSSEMTVVLSECQVPGKSGAACGLESSISTGLIVSKLCERFSDGLFYQH